MDLNRLLPIETLIPLVETYTPYTRDVFDFLNGRVNPYYNKCRLIISSYDKYNFAEFRKPDLVVIYLHSIISTFYPDDLKIKSVILMTLAHELSHACQETNMTRYGRDPYYKEEVEKTNEAHARQWVINNMDEIHKRFGFRMTFPKYAVEEAFRDGARYQQTSGKEFYIYAFVDLLYRKERFIDKFVDLFDQYSDIMVCINNGPKVWFKNKGNYLLDQDTVGQFSSIMQYCRRGISLGSFDISLNAKVAPIHIEGLPDRNILILDFIITNFRYTPIIGIETVSDLDSMRQNKEL